MATEPIAVSRIGSGPEVVLVHGGASPERTWGALIVAGREPDRVLSLTEIETPLFSVARGDPEVDEFERLGNEFLTRGMETEPEALRRFLRVAGA